MRYLTILLLLLLFAFQVRAQDIKTSSIKWNSFTTFDVGNGDTRDDTTTVTSYSDHIEWRSSDGSLKYSLTILETNGSWTNVAATGQVTFEVDNQGNRGTVLFQRDAVRTKIRFMILNGNTPEVFELTIVNTELL